MKDFSHDYIDYSNMAKQLLPETNTVQHWSKIIETKYDEPSAVRHQRHYSPLSQTLGLFPAGIIWRT